MLSYTGFTLNTRFRNRHASQGYKMKLTEDFVTNSGIKLSSVFRRKPTPT